MSTLFNKCLFTTEGGRNRAIQYLWNGYGQEVRHRNTSRAPLFKHTSHPDSNMQSAIQRHARLPHYGGLIVGSDGMFCDYCIPEGMCFSPGMSESGVSRKPSLCMPPLTISSMALPSGSASRILGLPWERYRWRCVRRRRRQTTSQAHNIASFALLSSKTITRETKIFTYTSNRWSMNSETSFGSP